jgi:glycosyltransferase involved in cell wall biosynthesis
MKILILNDLAAPHGGAEQLTLSLRDGLRERGHDARVFASSAHSDSGPNEADYSCFGTVNGLRTLNRVANASAAWNLRRTLDEFRPDVVHVRMFLTQLSPLILPALRAVPALYHATWHEAVCPTGLKLLPDRSICRHRAGSACFRTGCLTARAWIPLMVQMQMWHRWRDAFNVCISNSRSVREQLLEVGIGPVEVVLNGVAEIPARPPLRSPPTVTCATRLTWEKGIDVLIRAFAEVLREIPQSRLLILGSGPEEGALRRLAADLRIQASVDFAGRLARDEMNDRLDCGWVHAVPSLCAEGFGMSAAEASMRGTAVVGAGHGGLAEIIEDGETGRLVPPGDASALSTALLDLLRDRELAERMGRNGRIRARTLFDRGRWIDRFVKIYKKLLESCSVERRA